MEIVPLDAVAFTVKTAEQRLPAPADIAPRTGLGEGAALRREVVSIESAFVMSTDVNMLVHARANGKTADELLPLMRETFQHLAFRVPEPCPKQQHIALQMQGGNLVPISRIVTHVHGLK